MCNTLVSFVLITLSLWFKHNLKVQVKNYTGPACDFVLTWFQPDPDTFMQEYVLKQTDRRLNCHYLSTATQILHIS